MNPQLILIKCIAALYLRSKAKVVNDDAIEMILEVSRCYEGKSGTSVESGEISVLDGLVETVESLTAKDGELWSVDIKQIIKINTHDELDFESFVGPYLVEGLTDEEYKSLYTGILNDIRSFNLSSSLRKEFLAAKRELDFDVKPGDVNQWIERTGELLDKFKTGTLDGEIPGVVEQASFDDIEKIKELIDKGKSLVDGRFVMQLGWQNFIDALGLPGLVRGMCYLYNALSHNGKSFVASNIAHQIATLNTPQLLNPKLKPAIVVVSTEDPLYKYMYSVFKTTMERRLKRKLEPTDDTSVDTITSVLYEEFESRGYTLHFIQVDASFTRQGLFSLTDSIRAKGYEPHLLIVDYYEMFDRSSYGSALGNEDAIQEDLNYMKSKYRTEDTALVCPHQASTDMGHMKSAGVERLAVKMVEGGFKGCRGLHREADVTWAVNKLADAEFNTYLEFAFGKNKVVDSVSERHKYSIRKIEEWGGIHLDYNTEPLTLKSIDTGLLDALEGAAF